MDAAAPQPPPHQPPALRPGDRVRLVAASSALADLERLQAGLAVLAGWGLELDDDPARLLPRRWGYLAGRDAERAGDLLPDTDAQQPAALLACVRGGWGSARLLERPLEAAGGWLLGFSDVTSLLWHRLVTGQGAPFTVPC